MGVIFREQHCCFCNQIVINKAATSNKCSKCFQRQLHSAVNASTKCVINTYDKKTYTVTSETLKGFLPKTLETFDDKKVQVGNVQEKAQPEKFSHSKNRGGKKRN